jgi:hypothetical protein
VIEGFIFFLCSSIHQSLALKIANTDVQPEGEEHLEDSKLTRDYSVLATLQS